MKWEEWLENGWFEQLEKLGVAPENGNSYLGAGPDNGCSYWIGLLFPVETPVPDGFEYADNPTAKYVVIELAGKKAGELFGEEGHMLCMDEMNKRGLAPLGEDWSFERYNCLQLTDKKINTLFEWLHSI